MSRNIKKSPFFQREIKKKHDNFFCPNKNTIILPEYIGKIFLIYNGKQFLKLSIIDKMIGFKFGEFINSRKRHIYKKKKKKKK